MTGSAVPSGIPDRGFECQARSGRVTCLRCVLRDIELVQVACTPYARVQSVLVEGHKRALAAIRAVHHVVFWK